MEKIIRQILPLWGMESSQILQIYSSAWEINHSSVIKIYTAKEQMERNIKISSILFDCNIPVAEILPTRTGEKYAEYQNTYFLMSAKLPGSHISDIKNVKMAWKTGRAIAQLHRAFMECEKQMDFLDNSLLGEIKGWIQENLQNNRWQIISETEYTKSVKRLETVYDSLPRQLIHRDVHWGNFLFFDGNLSGYIDFDLSQKNIRIFDICYFLTGLLTEETEEPFTKNKWLESVKAVIAGYESVTSLSACEKNAIPCVMECIEILFTAYFTGIKDTKCAYDACNIFRFIQNCEMDLKNIL